jgi:SAM-dependent methyltransferase
LLTWLQTQGLRARKLTAIVLSGNVSELTYSLRNRLRKVDLDFVSVADLGLSDETSHFYSNSGGPEIQRVFKQVEIPRGSVVLDLGCGKGGALFSLARFPFTQLVGVDISPELIRIATDNAGRLGLRQVRFVAADAATFSDLDAVTHLYLYNPFPGVVMEQVMANVARSLAAAPRNLTIVYKNPVFHDQIAATGLFTHVNTLHAGEHAWHVYQHKA